MPLPLLLPLLLSFLLFRQKHSKHYSFIVIVHMKKHELKRVSVCSRYGAHCLAHIGAPFWRLNCSSIIFCFGKEWGNDLSSLSVGFFETPFHVIKSYGGTRNFSFSAQFIRLRNHKQWLGGIVRELSDKLHTILESSLPFTKAHIT